MGNASISGIFDRCAKIPPKEAVKNCLIEKNKITDKKIEKKLLKNEPVCGMIKYTI